MKRLILISGKMRSGKNAYADLLKKHLEAKGIPVKFDLFAKDLKDGVWDDFFELHTFIYKQFWKLPPEVRHQFSWMNIKKDDFYEDKTPYGRLLLQIYGTEIFRNRVDTDWWAKQVAKRYNEFTSGVYIVTDVRFPNEISVFGESEGEVISVRVNRNKTEDTFNEEHDSEKALDNFSNFDWVVDNNGTLVDLEENAKELIKRYGI